MVEKEALAAAEMETVARPSPEETTEKKISTTCSPLSKETSKEKARERVAGATETQGLQTQTVYQTKEKETDS